MSENGGVVIETSGLSKSFGEVEALKSLNLIVHERSICAFIGPNGAGKTTTIKLLLGLNRPTQGHGRVFGLDIGRDSIDIRARVGYLPQDFRFYEHMTARETLRYTAKFFISGPIPEIDKRVSATLELVSLNDIADRPIRGFSTGERQRLGIAQAEVNLPDLLILDEPAANLDPIGRREVLEMMGRIRERATIFYSTHILDDAQRVSDTVVVLNRGELVKMGAIHELLGDVGGIQYQVTLRGNHSSAYGRTLELPWVTDIQVTESGEEIKWEVNVTDADAAEDHLLSILMAVGDVKVTHFARKEHGLEDLFMNAVKEDGK